MIEELYRQLQENSGGLFNVASEFFMKALSDVRMNRAGRLRSF